MTNKNPEIKKKRTLLQKIVNAFLYTGIAIGIILILAFGITQTSTFRDYLRDTIVEKVNEGLNGKISIGKIDGTIFTSLFIRNTVLTLNSDTLLNAESIEVKTSPLQLLRKRIYIRKFELKNAKISLIKEADGKLNISKLAPPSAPDSSKSAFPLYIETPDFQLTNVKLNFQDYTKINSSETYDNLNMNDLRIKDLNLNLSAFIDISGNYFETQISNFNFIPNINDFQLKKLVGNFFVDTTGLYAEKMSLVTNNSEASLTAKVKNFNMFDTTGSAKFEKADLNINLNTDHFAFDDLSRFVKSTSVLKGTIAVKLNVNGTMEDLNLNELEASYLNTHLQVKGKLKDLDEANDMRISARFYNSYLYQPDINQLLPSLKLPGYKQLGVIKIDTLTFDGKPRNFITRLIAKTDKGNVSLKAALDMEKKLIGYNINFATTNLDLSPFINLRSKVNSHGNIKGIGISPNNLNAKVKFFGDGSVVENNKIDSLQLVVDAKDKKIDYQLRLKSDTAGAALKGNFDFTDNSKPTYEVNGSLHNLDLEKFTQDSTLKTNLNITLDGSGDHFDPQKLNAFVILKMLHSSIKGVNVDSTRAIVDLRSDDQGKRIINIISDLADITISGNYTVDQAIKLMGGEAQIISTAAKRKINQIMYPDSVYARQTQSGLTIQDVSNELPLIAVDSLNNLKYTIEFKDFSLLSVFLGDNKLELSGDMSGELKNTADSLYFSLNTNFESVKYYGSKDIFFISKLNLGLNLRNSFSANSFDQIYANMDLTTERLFTGTDYHNINANLLLKNDVASVSFSAKMEDYLKAKLNGNVDLSSSILNLNIDSLGVDYNQYSLINKKKINISYSKDKIDVKGFYLESPKGNINIEGFLARNQNQNLKININKISGKELSTNFFNMRTENSLGAAISMSSVITGNYYNPLMNIKFNVDSVTYRAKNFGFLRANFEYKNRLITSDIRFLDSLVNYNKPALSIDGRIPMDLAFVKRDTNASKLGKANISIKATDFNLGTLGDILPNINRLRGSLIADLNLNGQLNHLQPSGYLIMKNVNFIAQANEMEYDAGLKIRFKDNEILLDSMLVANVKGTPKGGTLTGSGKATLNGLEITSSQIAVNGQLKVLSEASKGVSPAVYGDLVIATNGNVEVTTDKNGVFLKAPINVEAAKLTFAPAQSAYQNSADNFIYRYVKVNTVKSGSPDFETLVNLSKERLAKERRQNVSKTSFDYNININVKNEATVVFVLSKETNFNLTAVLKGNFEYDNVGGRKNAIGELKLLDGSSLQFLKTLEATGTIRFESELSNPFLNITATYKSYYQPPDKPNTDEPVVVKINLNGPLNELNKNFLPDKNKIAVYVGSDAIDNGTADATKDVSDAMYFILTNKFASDGISANQNASSNPFAGTAISVAGSILGGQLNRYFGNYVQGVQLRSVGSTTKFNLTGSVNKFRYTIGGSTDVFQDISQANVKIEYPLLENLLLRLERKDAITETSIANEMINELGLKYRFVF